MRRRIAAVSFFLLAAVTTGFSQTWHTGALEDALAIAKKEKKLLLINFYSPSG